MGGNLGGTGGLGIEYAITQNWRAGVEGRYTGYGRISILDPLVTIQLPNLGLSVCVECARSRVL